MVEHKVGLYVLVDPETMKKLRALIKMKYETFYGALSQEVTDALNHWIADHESSLDVHTKTHTILNPRAPKLHAWLREIIRQLPVATHQVRREELEKAIGVTRGSDPRTYDKWIRELVRNGYMKVIGFGIFEVL